MYPPGHASAQLLDNNDHGLSQQFEHQVKNTIGITLPGLSW